MVKLETNPLQPDGLPCRPTGVPNHLRYQGGTMTFFRAPVHSVALNGINHAPGALGGLTPMTPMPEEGSLWLEAVWSVETEVVALMISESPLNPLFPFIEEYASPELNSFVMLSSRSKGVHQLSFTISHLIPLQIKLLAFMLGELIRSVIHTITNNLIRCLLSHTFSIPFRTHFLTFWNMDKLIIFQIFKFWEFFA